MVKVINDFAITYCIMMLYYQQYIDSYWHFFLFTIETILLYMLMYNIRRKEIPQEITQVPTNIVNVKVIKLKCKFAPNNKTITNPIKNYEQNSNPNPNQKQNDCLQKHTKSKIKMFNLIDI